MNLYFACSLTGGRSDEAIYATIVRHLVGAGHQVPTAHLADPSVMELEAVESAVDIYERDVGWIRECDGLIAEVSTPSHGVGYEIAFALGVDKPVLCCYRAGETVSKMILGNRSARLTVSSYADEQQLVAALDGFLAELAKP